MLASQKLDPFYIADCQTLAVFVFRARGVVFKLLLLCHGLRGDDFSKTLETRGLKP